MPGNIFSALADILAQIANAIMLLDSDRMLARWRKNLFRTDAKNYSKN